jgi:hypothetical protein
MLEEKQVRYLQYLALQAGRSIEITDSDIIIDKWSYSLPANNVAYHNTVDTLQYDIRLNRKHEQKEGKE